jgi:hypothetical protein
MMKQVAEPRNNDGFSLSFRAKRRTVLSIGGKPTANQTEDSNVTTTKMMLLATEDRDLGLVHSTKALARAKAEAKIERKTVFVRDEMTDEIEFVVRADGVVVPLQH